ncbi:MAG: hypothetical protein ACK5IQ_05590 [Bacteroidales bacterium]
MDTDFTMLRCYDFTMKTADKRTSLRGAGDEAISCNRNRLPC